MPPEFVETTRNGFIRTNFMLAAAMNACLCMH